MNVLYTNLKRFTPRVYHEVGKEEVTGERFKQSQLTKM
jgi:hypothetical protein